MRWVLLAILLALPAWADEISDATRAHLKSLEETAARLERDGNKGKYYEKVTDEIARIRKEYRLDVAPAATQAKPGASAAAAAYARAEAERRARAEADARAQAARNNARAEERATQNKARSEASRANSQWEKSKRDFASAAEEELRRRQRFSRFYQTRGDWQYAYNSQVLFAQKPIAAGGLGFDFVQADRWAQRALELQPPAAIESFRRRYAKALAYVRSPAEQGGLGYVRAYARKVALDQAQELNDIQLDKWIAQSRERVLSQRGGFSRFKDSCRSWYKAFGG